MPLESLLADFQFREHNAVLYTNITALHQLLIEYYRISFKSSNEILLILTSYDSIENLLKALKVIDINLDSRQKDGSLVIRESAKAYFNLADELVYIKIMVRMLLQRKRKLHKDGVMVICDMGIFFHKQRIVDLISLERTLALGINDDDNRVWMICCYEKSCIVLLTQQQSQQILCAHIKVLGF